MKRLTVLLNKSLHLSLCLMVLLSAFYSGGGAVFAAEEVGNQNVSQYMVTYDGKATEINFEEKGILHLTEVSAEKPDVLTGRFEDLTKEIQVDSSATVTSEAVTTEEYAVDGATEYEETLSTGEVIVFSLEYGDTLAVVPVTLPSDVVAVSETESTSDTETPSEFEKTEVVTTNENGSFIERIYIVDAAGEVSSEIGFNYYALNETGNSVEITKAEYDQLNGTIQSLASTNLTVSGPSVVYNTHVQNIGWQADVSNGATAGTTGKGLRLEAMRISLSGGSYSGSISYRTHVQNVGWMDLQSDGAVSGSLGKSQRMEAIQIQLTGDIAAAYDVYYRVHIQDIGWTAWTANGKLAGSEGMAKRLEAMEVKLVKKGDTSPVTGKAYYSAVNTLPFSPAVNYSSHVQNVGWQTEVKDGAISGTTGQAQRIEAVKIQLSHLSVEGSIKYRTQVEGIGWTSWSQDGAVSGTSGQAKRVEAIEVQLAGEIAAYYDVYYSVYSETYGWLGWAKNGESAGTEGLGKRVEAIRVLLVEKGNSAQVPKSTSVAFLKDSRPVITYQAHVQDYGWLAKVAEGELSGTTGTAKQLEAFQISLGGSGTSGGITYRSDVDGIGWKDWTTSGSTSGTIGAGKKVKAIEIKLTGSFADNYDVYYRVHAQNYGWLGWAKNGEPAGVEVNNTRLEAYEIKIVKKGEAAPGSIASPYIEAKQLIYLDPGHGGWDSGASFNGVYEKTINLKVANKVKALLEAKGYNVAMTRTTDVSVSGTTDLSTELLARAAMANAAKADIFVSIHHNSAGYTSTVSGIETFYYGYYAGWEPEINQAMHLDPARLANSVTLADEIQSSLISATGAKDRGIYDETFAVLRETAMPAVLLELGFMSNATELAKLATDSYQNILAQAVANGIFNYYQ
ncbi:N-acetylmuramoyl-L-alanine amidase [Trichococcus sp. K1Tr]|uniref:N-acetylmuramoyl-L-alanine amidase n=1 Tax=Trichococcus sp. K1Tr TaxID=3020847 RepID=UPI002330474E|nr:N-acetylmuramoyl-L-alanine amidase [Trichococcus sp. K1Tr]MDB6354125.1 N-acetylmuramoyl-L-alanine amidase [Trichococcus sp. K1Tr]